MFNYTFALKHHILVARILQWFPVNKFV